MLWLSASGPDDVYPVRVTCKNCPDDRGRRTKQFTPGKGDRAERVFAAAVIERKAAGPKIRGEHVACGRRWLTSASTGPTTTQSDAVSARPTRSGRSSVQTDFRPALLKLADAKPQVMLVSITAALLQMAQQYKQLGLTFTVAGTTFFQDPDVIKEPAAEGFVHTQLRIEAPPELAAEFKKKYGAEMEFFVRQYYMPRRSC